MPVFFKEKTSMETLEAIHTLRAVRSYRPEPVPDDILRQILNAGRLAQSSKNTQPWHFIVVRERERLNALAECGRYAQHIAHSAFTVVILQKTDWSFDIGQTAAYIQLAAWDLGVSSCPVYLHEAEKARKLLDSPPELGIQIAIACGYAAEPPRPAQAGGRRTLEQVVHWERW
jgi:nitroreductase